MSRSAQRATTGAPSGDDTGATIARSGAEASAASAVCFAASVEARSVGMSNHSPRSVSTGGSGTESRAASVMMGRIQSHEGGEVVGERGAEGGEVKGEADMPPGQAGVGEVYAVSLTDSPRNG